MKRLMLTNCFVRFFKIKIDMSFIFEIIDISIMRSVLRLVPITNIKDIVDYNQYLLVKGKDKDLMKQIPKHHN